MPPSSNKNITNFLKKLATTTLIIGLSTTLPAPAQNVNSPLKQNAPEVKTRLQEGQAVLNGSNGQYSGQMVVRGSLPTIWAVLTDYENFKKFMPNVVESRVLQRKGNQVVFEQVQIFQVLLLSRREKVKLAVTETNPKQIKFKVIEGYVKALQGSWKIEPLSSNLFLLTHQVSVEPDIKSDFNRKLFYSIYEDTLENTLKAVKEEIDRRS